jgi:Uma2 family endonuclease
MTVEEFLRVHGEDDENRYELIEGTVHERTLNGYRHDRVKNNLNKLFDRASIDRRGFESWVEHSFRLSNSVVTPDVAIIASERLSERTGDSPTAGAPEIVFEVALSDKPNVLQRKVSAYLRNGAHAVCCVYPHNRNLVVYTAHEWRELNESDTLESPALLPGVAIPVSAIFEGV